MARKITEEAVAAFLAGRPYCKSNTTVAIQEGIGISRLILRGNMIAKLAFGKLWISTAGWNTVTTRECLNGIPGVSVYQRKGQLYLNDKPWDGEITHVEQE